MPRSGGLRPSRGKFGVCQLLSSDLRHRGRESFPIALFSSIEAVRKFVQIAVKVLDFHRVIDTSQPALEPAPRILDLHVYAATDVLVAWSTTPRLRGRNARGLARPLLAPLS